MLTGPCLLTFILYTLLTRSPSLTLTLVPSLLSTELPSLLATASRQPGELSEALINRLRKQSVALGTAMKAAHGLGSDTHITRDELTAMLLKNFKDSKIDHGDLQAEKVSEIL